MILNGDAWIKEVGHMMIPKGYFCGIGSNMNRKRVIKSLYTMNERLVKMLVRFVDFIVQSEDLKELKWIPG